MTFFGALLLAVAAFFGWKYRRHKVSERWPKVTSMFKHGALEVQHDDYDERFSVWMKFEYQVADETYRGKYNLSSGTEGKTQKNCSIVFGKVRSMCAIIPRNRKSTFATRSAMCVHETRRWQSQTAALRLLETRRESPGAPPPVRTALVRPIAPAT